MKVKEYSLNIDPIKAPYGYIYSIFNQINGKYYIGQSRRIYKNNYLNKKNIINYYGSGSIIKKAILKYGRDNFCKSILDYAYSKEELNRLEIYYIKKKNTLIPNGYNLREGGNLTGKYYTGQMNPCSCSNMSRMKRVLKSKKASVTRYKNGTVLSGDKNPLSIKNYGYENILIKNRKSHKTAKLRGTDKIRIQNMLKTRKRFGINKIAGIKSSLTIKKSGILKYENNPRAKKYKITSPKGTDYVVFGRMEQFCERHKLNRRTLLKFLNQGKIDLIKNDSNYSTISSKNCHGWNIKEDENV